MEIMYDQVKECIDHDFIKYLIEMEYGITVKPITLGSPNSNEILEQIHQVLENLVCTYNIDNTCIDEYNPWLVILAAS